MQEKLVVRTSSYPQGGVVLDPLYYAGGVQDLMESFGSGEDSLTPLKEISFGEIPVEQEDNPAVNKAVSYSNLLKQLNDLQAKSIELYQLLDDNERFSKNISNEHFVMGLTDYTTSLVHLYGSPLYSYASHNAHPKIQKVLQSFSSKVKHLTAKSFEIFLSLYLILTLLVLLLFRCIIGTKVKCKRLSSHTNRLLSF